MIYYVGHLSEACEERDPRSGAYTPEAMRLRRIRSQWRRRASNGDTILFTRRLAPCVYEYHAVPKPKATPRMAAVEGITKSQLMARR